ncbi:DUF4381 family protein [Chimaeribacter arupi]|uniref:DUF4381 family protein n=1 Tax=Chimaeribacter arupi TaxID=2060066 RepID=UPI000C79F400|nr:DUF4381 family protein [Chimaeribacter arupi]PLR30070.1 DUF4381 domain-containing protein [Chimaeribacter arupi]
MLAKGFSTPELAHPALPAAASWFPLPAGWMVLGVMLLLAMFIALLILLARFRRNRWRREARKQLGQQYVDGWLAWVKRVLLVQHPRAQVSQWQSPEQLLAQTTLDEELRALMCRRYCQPDNRLESVINQRIAQQLRHWLETLPHV